MKIDNHFLYRGESKDLYKRNSGSLIPKSLAPFEQSFSWDKIHIKWEALAVKWKDLHDDDKLRNAVIVHQLGYPTKGVSTTPHFNRAKYYALGGGKHSDGVVYEIDQTLLCELNIKEFVVANIDWPPKNEEDDEIILVFKDDGPLPIEIISNTFKVRQ